MTIDTACSSSLVAVNQAVQALRSGVSRMAVAAGVQLILGPEPYIVESTFHMLSPSGRCRMWDASADGYGRGDGVAAVVLKTLSQAIADGDRIECIIREIGVNQDGGATSGITVPNPDAQISLIRDTYRRAGLDLGVESDRPQFFECHGTGTPTGDPLEATAIHEAFGQELRRGSPPLYVGSIKTVIGHTEATAGIAGLLKASLAVQEGLIPPNLLFDKLNPAIEPLYTGLEVPVGRAIPWPQATAAGRPRRVSVNSFGFGGTNAHAIVESYDGYLQQIPESKSQPPLPYTFSATTKASLERMLADFAGFLEASFRPDEDRSSISSHELAFTLNSRRSLLSARAVFAARGPVELSQKIRAALGDASWEPTAMVNDTAGKETRPPRILGVFAGQGAQWAGMARHLAEDVPFVAQRLAELDAVLAGLPAEDRPSWSLREELTRVQGSRLDLAEFAQPLCTALQIIQVDLLAAANIHFAAVVGHSSGEIAAAYAAGFLSARDALVVAYYRGVCCSRLKAAAKGAMMAVGSSITEMRELVSSAQFQGRICVAAHNSPTSVTLSGDEDAILEAKDLLARDGKFVRLLRVDQAYHSHHMQPCMDAYIQELAKAGVHATNPGKKKKKQHVAWYSSVFGLDHGANCLSDAISTATNNDEHVLRLLDGQYWALNMRQTVLFADAVEAAVLGGGSDTYSMAIGIGAHGALRAPLDEILTTVRGQGLPYTSALTRNTDDSLSFLQAIGEVWARAPSSSTLSPSKINLGQFQVTVYGLSRQQLVPLKRLPSYPWDHTRTFWHESRRSRALRTRPHPAHPLLGTLAPDSTPTDLAWHNHLRVTDLPWLRGHRLQGQIIYPAAAYMASVIHAALHVASIRQKRAMKIELRDMFVGKAIVLEDQGSGGVELVTTLHLADGDENDNNDEFQGFFRFRSVSLGSESTDAPVNASGSLVMTLADADAAADEKSYQQEPMLSPRKEPPPLLVNVEEGPFYSALDDLGYQYTNSFRSLSQATRKLGYAQAALAVPAPQDMSRSEKDLLLHPGTLDALFQAVFLAYAWPDDGRLWSMHVPVAVDRIQIDVEQILKSRQDTTSSTEDDYDYAQHYTIDAHITMDPSVSGHAQDGLGGEVGIYSNGSNNNSVTLIQAEGVRLAPLATAPPSEDVQMFLENVDGVAFPDCALAMTATNSLDGSASVDRAPDEETGLGWLLERIAHFYLARLARDITPEEESCAEWHHQKLMNYARHAAREVAAGRMRFAKAEWARDTDNGGEGQRELHRLMDDHMDKIDVQLMRSVGEHLPAAVRGETVILQHMVQNGMLNRSYEETLGVKPYSIFLASVIAQIAHVYPTASILEIGAGTGGATKRILQRIPYAFGHYTFTDISSGFFEAAETIFATHVDSGRMSFRTLDIERDPVAQQGFEAHAYDVVLASFVLHATADLENTLRNARRLLRPGGYLVLLEMTSNDTMRLSMTMGGLEGWWLGADTGRPWSPCVSTAEWHALLHRAGFTGVEQSTPELDPLARPFGVLVSRALDDRVKLLLEPSSQSPAEISSSFPMSDLLILSGSQLSSIRLAERVARILQPFLQAPATIVSDGMKGFLGWRHHHQQQERAQERKNLTVLYLADIDNRSLLEDTKPEAFNGLKELFASSPDQMLWVTRGAQKGERPYAVASIGLGRALIMEYPEVTMQFLDFAQEPDARTVVDDLLRLRMLHGLEQRQRQNRQQSSDNTSKEKETDVLWCRELEIAVDREGRRWISRILPHRHFNDGYNSARRSILSLVNLTQDDVQIYEEFKNKGPSVRSVVRVGQLAACSSVSNNGNTIQVRPRLSAPLAVVQEEAGFVSPYEPMWQHRAGRTWNVSIGPSSAAITSSGSAIILSDRLGSPVSPVTENCLVPLDPELNGSYCLSAVANSLVATLIAQEAEHNSSVSHGTINMLVLVDPGVALAREVLARSRAAKTWNAISLTTSRAKQSTAPDVFTLIDASAGKRTMRATLFRAFSNASSRHGSSHRIGTIVIGSDFTTQDRAAYTLAQLLQSSVPELTRAKTKAIGDLLEDAHGTPSSSSDSVTTALAATFCQVVQDVVSDRASLSIYHHDKVIMDLISPKDYVDKQRITTEGNTTIIDWSLASSHGQELTAVARPLDGVHPLLRGDRTYLLLGLGGKGGLGSTLAEYLVHQGARHIILTSRNPGVDAKLTEAYAKQGVKIQGMANDITHGPSLRALIAGLRASPDWPPIGGVANGAMVLADVSLQNMTYDEFVRVLRPKVDGTLLVDQIFFQDELDFFLLFSSLSCVLGNRGQANYDAANMFLVGLAAQRRARGVAASVVDIGAIMGTGYMAREVKEQTLKQMVGAGFNKMSERDFFMAFAHGILAGRGPQHAYEVITGLYVPPANNEFQPGWIGNPRFSHMVARSRVAAGQRLAGSSSDSSQAESTQQLLQRARTLSDVSRVVATAIIKKMTHILQLSDEVASDHAALLQRSTSALGVDSLVAVEFRAWMLREFEVDIPVFKILADTAIRDMVEFAVEAMPDTVTPNLDRSSTEDAISADAFLEGGRKAGTWDAQKTKKLQAPAPEPVSISTIKVTERGSSSSSLSSSATHHETTSPSTTNETVFTPQSRSSTRMMTPLTDLLSSVVESGTVNNKSLLMSYGQSRFWFMSQLSLDATACNVVNDIEIRADLDNAALSRAVHMLGVRHEALRTAFKVQSPNNWSEVEKNGCPEQVILRESPLHLETVKASNPSEVDEHFRRLHNMVYNLETGELIRMVLVSLSPRLHRLLIGYHHINMDSASMAILVDEMLRLYDGQILPPPRVQQADLALHQRKQLDGGRWAKQIAYWREEFATTTVHLEPLPILSLSPSSISRSRPERPSYCSTSHKTRVSAVTAKQVQALCRRTGVTVFHLYTAVFQVLLGRLVRHPVDRIVIGMADANRSLDLHDLSEGVGNFLNIVPLLLDMPPDHQPVDRVLQNTRDKILLAMSNAVVPFEIILEQAQAPRSQSHSPLFQAFIDYKRVTEKLPIPGGKGEVEGKRYLLSKTPYDLMLDIIDTPQGDASLELHVQEGLYTSEEAEVLLGLFVNLLESLSRSDPEAEVGEARIFVPGQVNEAVRLGKGEVIPFEQGSIVPRLDTFADALADASALEGQDGAALTWSQLKGKSEAVAHALNSQGINALGARVAVLQEPTADWVCTMLGIWRAGASYVPLEVAQGLERLRDIAKAARVAAVVAHDRTLALIPELQLASKVPVVNISNLSWAHGSQSESVSADPVVTAEDEAIVLYTSGSTGVPKGISVPHRVVVNAIDGMLRRWPELNTQPQIVLQQAALSFDLSWWTAILGLCTKGTVVVASRDARSDPRQLTQLIIQRGITFTVATPSETVTWLQSHEAAALRSCKWRWHVAGGEPFSLGLVRHLFSLNKPSLRVLNAYGPTETWMPLSHEVEYQQTTTQDDVDKLWPVPLGTVMPNYTVCVVDAHGRVLPAGMPGQLVIGGAGVARGYVDQPALTAQRFGSHGIGDGGHGTAHLSGDCGYLRAEDGMFMMLGRIDGDTQVKLRGLRIDLREVENSILAQAQGQISDAVVSMRDIAIGSSILKEEESTNFLAAHVVLSPSAKAQYGSESKRAEFLRAISRELPLPEYMHPTTVIPVDALPLTPNGKLDRRAVRHWPVSLHPSTSQITEADGDIDKMRQIWGHALGFHSNSEVEALGPQADFFHVGGNSILLTRVQSRLRTQLGVDVPLRKLFHSSTLGQMASLLFDKRTSLPHSDSHSFDWQQEIALPSELQDGLQQQKKMMMNQSPTTKRQSGTMPAGLVVALTGATGFLGRHLVQQLLDNPAVGQVHCLAVRNQAPLARFVEADTKAKLVIHRGDLAKPNLGIENAAELESVFRAAQVLIHNGADTSFLKSYATLRPTNVESLKTMARLTLLYRNRAQQPAAHIHFVSTAGVATYLGRDLGEESLGRLPPRHITEGYLLTKWVGELVVEKIGGTVHRLTAITGPGAPELDVVSSVMRYSAKVGAVPVLQGYDGCIQFVAVEEVARGIVENAVASGGDSSGADAVEYRNHCGDAEGAVELSQLGAYLQKKLGRLTPLPVVNDEEWVTKAEAIGFPKLLGQYLRADTLGGSGKRKTFRRLLI